MNSSHHTITSASRAADCDPRTFKSKAAQLGLTPVAVLANGQHIYSSVAVAAVAAALGRTPIHPLVITNLEPQISL